MKNTIKLKDGGAEIHLEMDDGRFDMNVVVYDMLDATEVGVVLTREEVGKLTATLIAMAASDIFSPLTDVLSKLGNTPQEGDKQ